MFCFKECKHGGLVVKTKSWRKMLRNIVGWRRLEGEPWPDTMRRMRDRVSNLMQQTNLRPWEYLATETKWKLALRIACHPETRWARQHADATCQPPLDHAAECQAIRGRPRTQWHDNIAQFLRHCGFEEHQQWTSVARQHQEWWNRQSDNFVHFVTNY